MLWRNDIVLICTGIRGSYQVYHLLAEDFCQVFDLLWAAFKSTNIIIKITPISQNSWRMSHYKRNHREHGTQQPQKLL